MASDPTELLRRYIAWVKANAGTDFLDRDRSSYLNQAQPRTNYLDDDEWAALFYLQDLAPESPIEWSIDQEPAESGWYATTHCWDGREGAFASAHYWDGGWSGSEPLLPIVQFSSMPFATRESALAWAEQHAD